MTSFIDGIFGGGSDAPGPSTPASSGLPTARRRTERSSSRPRGPPSESAGAPSDIDGFHDDEVVGVRGTVARPRGPPGDVPKVVDRLGEALVGVFETFLEKYGKHLGIVRDLI
jgi:DNA replication licensing factor MCM6